MGEHTDSLETFTTTFHIYVLKTKDLYREAVDKVIGESRGRDVEEFSEIKIDFRANPEYTLPKKWKVVWVPYGRPKGSLLWVP